MLGGGHTLRRLRRARKEASRVHVLLVRCLIPVDCLKSRRFFFRLSTIHVLVVCILCLNLTYEYLAGEEEGVGN